MTQFGVERLIGYEEAYYPKRRNARSYTGKGREQLIRSLMDAFEGIEDRDVLNAYIKMARGGHSMPTVCEIIEAAGWAGKVEADKPAQLLSGSDIDRKTSRTPQWLLMKQLDIQDDRTVQSDEYYQKKYGY